MIIFLKYLKLNLILLLAILLIVAWCDVLLHLDFGDHFVEFASLAKEQQVLLNSAQAKKSRSKNKKLS